jgi:hypothetical protein
LLFEILNTIWFFLLALAAIGLMLGVWVAIGLWNALAQRAPVTAETVLFQGGDDD